MSVDKVIEYLEAHKTKRVGDYYHHKLILDVIDRFHAISHNPPFRPYKEVDIVRDGEKKGRVDLAVVNAKDELYIVEAKVIRSLTPTRKSMARIRNEINNQLRRYHGFFREVLGFSGKAMAVYRHLGNDRFRFYHLPLDSEQWLDAALQDNGRGLEGWPF